MMKRNTLLLTAMFLAAPACLLGPIVGWAAAAASEEVITATTTTPAATSRNVEVLVAEMEARLLQAVRQLETKIRALEADKVALQAHVADLEARLGAVEEVAVANNYNNEYQQVPMDAAAAAAAAAAGEASTTIMKPNRKLLQTALETRVATLEKKLKGVSNDADLNFCLGNSCFVPSGDYMAIQHKTTKKVIITWDNNPLTGDFIRFYPPATPGTRGNQFFFVDNDLHFGMWNTDVQNGVPAGTLRTAAICPSKDDACNTAEVIRKVAVLTTDTDGNLCVGNSCLVPSGDTLTIRHKTSKQNLIWWSHVVVSSASGDFIRMYQPARRSLHQVLLHRKGPGVRRQEVAAVAGYACSWTDS